jgi:hypothetical protein
MVKAGMHALSARFSAQCLRAQAVSVNRRAQSLIVSTEALCAFVGGVNQALIKKLGLIVLA